MADEPRSGLSHVILIWVVGLTLGVAAGAATAFLLMPAAAKEISPTRSLGDQLRRS